MNRTRDKVSRGHLSSIDRLPEEAGPLVDRALDQLRERKATQTEILDELNEGLGHLGIEPVSWGAFHRKSVWLMTHGADMQETREIAAAMNETLSKTPDSDIGRLLIETVKTMIHKALTKRRLDGDGDLDFREVASIARSVKDLEQALRLNVATTENILNRFTKDASAAVDRVAGEKGLTPDTIETIKRDILGLRADPSETDPAGKEPESV